jgi:hypothetical protein
MEDAKDIKFEIVRKFGALSESARGWSKELNIVSWNDREPKLDIRDWAEDHERMGKGVTLTRDEAAKLHEYLGIFLKR